MTVKELSVKEIKPYKNNPRINDYAVEKVQESIQRYGMKQPLVIDKDNVIVVGHTRFEACKKLGYKKVPCVIADDLTEEQINAYRLVDNKVAEYATWDYSLLNMELAEIGEDLTTFDFPDFTIQDDPSQEELEALLEDNIKKSPSRERTRQIEPDDDFTIPNAVIERDLEDDITESTIEVICYDAEQENELYAFLNEHGYIYEKRDVM